MTLKRVVLIPSMRAASWSSRMATHPFPSFERENAAVHRSPTITKPKGFSQHRSQGLDNFPDFLRRHFIADTPEQFVVRSPDRLPELGPQVSRRAAFAGPGQEAGQLAHVFPVARLKQRPGQRH